MASTARRMRAAAGAALLAGLALVGCDSSSSPDPGAAALADGVHFGFVSAFTGGNLEFEAAQMFTGDEAAAEAAKDGEGEPPNNSYIRRSAGDPISLPVASGASVTVIVSDTEGVKSRIIDVTTLEGVLSGEVDGSAYYTLRDGLPALGWPAEITVADGVVVDIDEYYLP